jgi:hypothetical protein
MAIGIAPGAISTRIEAIAPRPFLGENTLG